MIRVRGVSGCAPLRRHTAHLNSNLRDDGVLLLAPKNRKTARASFSPFCSDVQCHINVKVWDTAEAGLKVPERNVAI